MSRFSNGSRGRQAAVAVASASVVVAGLGGLAYAQTPSSQDGTISACFKKADGILKIIDKEAGETCGNKEQLLQWNQKGVKGDAGTPGADGKDGEDGKDGKDGKDGAPGASAYQIWLENGGSGTETDFLDSLKADVDALVNQLKANDHSPNDPSDPVSWFNIKDLTIGGDGVITREYLATGSVRGGSDSSGSEILDGTVTADDLAGGSVTGAKLADGSVRTNSQTANAAQGYSGPGPLSLAVGSAAQTAYVSMSVPGSDASTKHAIKLDAQFQASLAPSVTDVVTIKWRIVDGLTPVTPEYIGQLSPTSPMLVGSVSWLTDQGEGQGEPYSLSITASSSSASDTVDLSNAQISAVDLGRTP